MCNERRHIADKKNITTAVTHNSRSHRMLTLNVRSRYIVMRIWTTHGCIYRKLIIELENTMPRLVLISLKKKKIIHIYR